MENISNRSVENYWIELGIFTLSQISISIVLSILVIIIIFISRSEIKSIEFHTLILLNVFTILILLQSLCGSINNQRATNISDELFIMRSMLKANLWLLESQYNDASNF